MSNKMIEPTLEETIKNAWKDDPDKTEKADLIRIFTTELLLTQFSPEDWDIKGYPLVKKYNEAGNIHLDYEELENLFKDVKYELLHGNKNEGAKVSLTKKNEVEKDKLLFYKSSDIVSKPIDWLWKDKIAKGKVTLIAGDPGLGKSQTTIHIAGIVSMGGFFPGGHECKQGKVLFFSAEDDPEDTINPRLQAVNANRENIYIFNCVKKEGKEKTFDLSKDMELLEKTVENIKDVSLIIVDPITAFLGETDSHVNAEVRALLSMLSKLASRKSIAIVVVTHLNKSTGGSPLNKITGSLAFVAAARAAYMVIKDENDENRRLFLPVKNNLAEDKGGFAFKIEGVDIGNGIRTSRVSWESEGISMSLIEAMKEVKSGRGTSGVDIKTVERLEGILKNYPDGLLTNDFVREAAKVGISKRTLYRAKDDMMVDMVGTGRNNTKRWKLIFNEDGMVNDEITEDAISKF